MRVDDRRDDQRMCSVVIPVRDGAPTIARQLDAVAAQSSPGPWEVVVADNGSTDDTVAVAAAYRSVVPSLTIVDAGGEAGINRTRNAGWRAARGRLVLFCDADDVVRPGWLAALGAIDADLAFGTLENRTLNPDVDLGEYGLPERTGRPGGRTHGDEFLLGGAGNNCAIRRDVLESIGGFDERYRRGATEVPLFFQAQLDGHTVAYVPEAEVAVGLLAHHAYVRRRFRYAQQHVRVYRDFRGEGMPRASLGTALRWWAWLVVRAPRAVVDRRFRARWLLAAARRAGRLVGSARYRAWCP